MAIYQFKARERAGKVRAGVLQADDQAGVLKLLEEQGLLPIRVVEKKTAPALRAESAGGGLPFLRKKVKANEIITFTRQLETLLDAGIPLTQSLTILEDQTSGELLKASVGRVREYVEQGSSFAEALGREPKVFPNLYVNMLRAGEEGGVMAQMLERTATLLEHEAETRERVQSALFYPQLILSELVLAFAVLCKFVLPRYTAFFKGMGAKLPLPTRIMIAGDVFIEKNGLWLLLGAVALVGAFMYWVRQPYGRWKFHEFQIRVPLFGEIILKSIMSRFARVLAALIDAGIPITVALDIGRRVAENIVVEREVARMAEGIVDGKGVTGSLEGSTVFPPLVVKMLAVGEETGTMDKMLLKVSSYFDRDVEYAVKNLTQAIEPILLVIMGVAVLFIALAIFLPMWNLMQAMTH